MIGVQPNDILLVFVITKERTSNIQVSEGGDIGDNFWKWT